MKSKILFVIWVAIVTWAGALICMYLSPPLWVFFIAGVFSTLSGMIIAALMDARR